MTTLTSALARPAAPPRRACLRGARARPRSRARELKGTVKEILGTAKSTGCTVNGEDPQVVQENIDEGEYDIPDK